MGDQAPLPGRSADPVISSPVRRPLILLTLAVLLASPLACSRSTDIESTARSTTTERSPGTTDPLDAAALASGAAAIRDLQSIVDGMLASTDPCAILTQRDLEENQLDPSIFTTAAARAVVTNGLIAVYDHLIAISPPEITAPLTAQKAVLVDVLAVVERYASSTDDSRATQKINSLVSAPGYLAAQTQLTAWVTANCR
jgi:hypothetical protein